MRTRKKNRVFNEVKKTKKTKEAKSSVTKRNWKEIMEDQQNNKKHSKNTNENYKKVKNQNLYSSMRKNRIFIFDFRKLNKQINKQKSIINVSVHRINSRLLRHEKC